MKIRIAGIKKESLIDGPGVCFVVFLQGCLQNCKGCHNPESRPLDGGTEMFARDLLNEIFSSKGTDTVVFSGGEPFLQAAPLAFIGKELRKKKYRLAIFTGYTYEFLLNEADTENNFLGLLELADLLIDGPYIEEEKDYDIAFRGSKNQRIIDVKPSLKENKIILKKEYSKSNPGSIV